MHGTNKAGTMVTPRILFYCVIQLILYYVELKINTLK